MEQTWRWFGPKDPIPLAHIRQAGATGIVTALHHIPNGTEWPVEEIAARKRMIEDAGLTWSVVESVPVSEEIKTRTGAWRAHIDAYAATLRNLAACGVRTVCYNFMPVLDWTRTDLAYELPDGSRALRFDADQFAAFELFILRRSEAEAEYGPDRARSARAAFEAMDESARERLVRTIIAGLPGAEESYTLDQFRGQLDRYRDIGADGLRSTLSAFVQAVAPVAEEAGVRLGIHPDDPPRPLLGLPRVVSTAADVRWLLEQSASPSHGLTFCAGSFGVRPDNDLPAMFAEFRDRVHFLHLRSTKREADPQSFHEAHHLDGDVDMVALIRVICAAQRERQAAGRPDAVIPMRPDHGLQMLDDLGKVVNPGYSAIGRLKGLAELRGIMRAVQVLDAA
ncbi:mannonate dehydratase [Azospirillum sp. RWY-5-1]|uniref:Mannonate dehydratase n=1 Tax=Azospirillum oleiclasticum TaxID=2735135 RepID=A0ABX2T8Q5_9PROT|nr:mannonate dehydratase [Azospirillum oleiclasticum]NYZ12358.1 mannonate dehydratase [Azospirillum oleiclasticum]NYZ19518.1 mannonate dehydratase [Azospirillum oleiclasticum]